MAFLVGNRLTITGVADEFHRVCDDRLRVTIPSASGVGNCVTEGFKAEIRRVLDDLVDFGDLQPMRQVPFQQWGDQQYLFGEETTDEASSRFWHDVVLLGKRLHEGADIITGNVRIFEDGRHFTEMRFEFVGHMKVTFHHPKQCIVLDRLQNLCLS